MGLEPTLYGFQVSRGYIYLCVSLRTTNSFNSAKNSLLHGSERPLSTVL